MNNKTNTASIAIDELGKVMGGNEIGPRKPKLPFPTGTPPYNPNPFPTTFTPIISY